MSLRDLYAHGAQSGAARAPVVQQAQAPGGHTSPPKSTAVTFAVIAAGMFAVFVVVPYLNRPKQVVLPKAEALPLRGHQRDVAQAWRALV